MKRLLYVVIVGVFMLMGVKNLLAETTLLGAGATFPYPLYSKMFDAYHKQTGIKVNYQAIGSGGGIRQIREKTVDFGASDAFLSDEELKQFKSPVVHIPTTQGAVVITYNLPQNPELKLTPEIIADIFLGKIKKWNNEEIKKINPDVKLPDMNITVVHRSDGSGTTFIFSDYLSKVDPLWEKKVGRGKALNWPCGLGGKGNPGVAGLVKEIPGAIGYVELAYAIQNKMPYAAIKNKSGNFVKPDIKSISLASNTDLPQDMRVSLTNTDAENGYPISSFTWIIVYKDLSCNIKDKEKAKALVHLLWWMTHEGQKFCKPLLYAPLSENAQKRTEEIIKSLTFRGEKLLN